MEESNHVFAFDIERLFKNNEERCFEMIKAENYKMDETSMYWKYGENICPEMQMAIRMAKTEFTHLWPMNLSDISIAEIVFHIVSLQKCNQVLIEENQSLKLQLQRGVSLPAHNVSAEELMTSMADVSMSTICDETMTPTNYFKPVPGVNTILACGEKSRIDKDQSTALTAKVCQGIDQIAQMFYDTDTIQQDHDSETLHMGDTTMAISDSNPCQPKMTSAPFYGSNKENVPRSCSLQILKDNPSIPLNIHKDLPPTELPLGHRPGFKERKDESEKPLGLQIFKDPEGLAGHSEVQKPPLRAFGQRFSPTKPHQQHQIRDENLVPRALHDDFNQLNLTSSRIDLVPCCASTAVFSVPKKSILPSPIAPISGGGGGRTNPISSPTIEPKVETQLRRPMPPQSTQIPEFKQDDIDMDTGNSGNESPNRPTTPLAAAFNQFVHSPDQSGRLRIDATKFMEAFLTKKNKNPSGTGERKWPPMF